jgi:DNA-directed RNA polymerase omega subunit
MFKVSSEKLLKNSGGQYKLLRLAFDRTRQLNNGMPPTIKVNSKKNATIALKEIAEGTVRLTENENDPESSEQ